MPDFRTRLGTELRRYPTTSLKTLQRANYLVLEKFTTVSEEVIIAKGLYAALRLAYRHFRSEHRHLGEAKCDAGTPQIGSYEGKAVCARVEGKRRCKGVLNSFLSEERDDGY